MGLRLQRAALPELLAHPAHRRHAKPQKFRDLSSALVPFIELQNAPTHGKRYGSHKRTLSHLFLFVKLYYLWKCSNIFNHPDFDAPNNNVTFFPNFSGPPSIPPTGSLGIIQHTVGSPRFLQLV